MSNEFSADEFFAAIEAGIFATDRRVFLWNGRIFEWRAKTVAHAATSVLIHRALSATIPDGWLLWRENPIRLDPRHAPMPDIPVVRGRVERYTARDRHP